MSKRRTHSVWAALRTRGVLLSYDPRARAGVIVIPADCTPPDRTTVLRLFQRIDDRVLSVDITTPDELIASYRREVLSPGVPTTTGQAVIH